MPDEGVVANGTKPKDIGQGKGITLTQHAGQGHNTDPSIGQDKA